MFTSVQIQNMLATAVVLGVLGIIILMATEIQKWRKKRTIVHGMQLFVRMMGGMLMLILLAHLFGGIMYAQPGDLPTAQFVLYWIKCVLLALALCLVAVVDVLLIMRHRQQHRKRLQNLTIDLLSETHELVAGSKQ
jgi:phosphoglycerol transferase MdoB-like AlkP superfamily enzyme